MTKARHRDTEDNGIQHDSTDYSDTWQHNDTQRNGAHRCGIQHWSD